MDTLSATIRLRPTRIGFLVAPNDNVALRKIMQANCCLWGGVYNPIIPVFRVTPSAWRPDHRSPRMGSEFTAGYVHHFEPDVYVEARPGLLERVGLGALRDRHGLTTKVMTLSEFLRPHDDREFGDPRFGLSMYDVYDDLHEKEYRFQQRKPVQAIQVPSVGDDLSSECIHGVFPDAATLKHIRTAYSDVFEPTQFTDGKEAWCQHFMDGHYTPLGLTTVDLDRQRFWHHEPVIYIFDPTVTTDVIDLWNSRLDPSPKIPVPVAWALDLAREIVQIIKHHHRPISGNPQGLMHRTTLHFSSSIEESLAKTISETIREMASPDSFRCRRSRRDYQKPDPNDPHPPSSRMLVTAKDKRTWLPIEEESGKKVVSFEAMTPDRYQRHSMASARWVNVLQFQTFGRDDIAPVYPFNPFDRAWPAYGRGSDYVAVGSEGWVFPQDYSGWTQRVELNHHDEAVIGSLKRFGIEAKLSDNGQVAEQMLTHLGGLWGVNLIADPDLVTFLNKMAMGFRRKSNETEEVEELFHGRSVDTGVWNRVIERFTKERARKWTSAEYTERNIIRLGLETDCPYCFHRNWHSLTIVDYSISCERCLNQYGFPEGRLRGGNRNWRYRVVGPFSVPDFGRGSYSTLLALRVLDGLSGPGSHMTFSPGLDCLFDGDRAEADFFAWYARDQMDLQTDPIPVIGEAKSFGFGDLIKDKDIQQIKKLAERVPHSYLVVSFLKDELTASEIAKLRKLAEWGRAPDEYGRARHPLIVLTGTELFFDYLINVTWEEKGGRHKDFADFEHTYHLYSFAEATQMIYLDLPAFHVTIQRHWERRNRRRDQ